ncbi:MAG: hypothetical protein C4B59_03730 [Candidatus Methanogaster sp.]|uniref:Uncharacterized protein n=1 Tax=Candidatus Methanogaster sp. TaxID=3386292 RepID=A0AC61L4Q4_9EURY|nr:MAG: hypothetical protein C4B59_03730 [ANME-2 cluster archaeon]
MPRIGRTIGWSYHLRLGDGGNRILRGNRINKNDCWAVWIFDGWGSTIEDNNLSDNAGGAWNISPDSAPNIRRARNKE